MHSRLVLPTVWAVALAFGAAGCRRINAPTALRGDGGVETHSTTLRVLFPEIHDRTRVRLHYDNRFEVGRESALYREEALLLDPEGWVTLENLTSTNYFVDFEWSGSNWESQRWIYGPLELGTKILDFDLRRPNVEVKTALVFRGVDLGAEVQEVSADFGSDFQTFTTRAYSTASESTLVVHLPSAPARVDLEWKGEDSAPFEWVGAKWGQSFTAPDSLDLVLEVEAITLHVVAGFDFWPGVSGSFKIVTEEAGAWEDVYLQRSWRGETFLTFGVAKGAGASTLEFTPRFGLSRAVMRQSRWVSVASGDTVEVQLGEFGVRILLRDAGDQPLPFTDVTISPLSGDLASMVIRSGWEGEAVIYLNAGSYGFRSGTAFLRSFVTSDTMVVLKETP